MVVSLAAGSKSWAKNFTGVDCKNCGERKGITTINGQHYGFKTTVVGPGHDITELAPADFHAWCPNKPTNRPEEFNTGTMEGK